MIKHGINVLQLVTEFLNVDQTPVMAFDAPLFALVKFVQWKWPDTHGENKFIAIFAGLHIQLAMWKTFGDYLEGSGWTNALTQVRIASAGSADSFLKASHLTCSPSDCTGSSKAANRSFLTKWRTTQWWSQDSMGTENITDEPNIPILEYNSWHGTFRAYLH